MKTWLLCVCCCLISMVGLAQLPTPGTIFQSTCTNNQLVATKNLLDIELLTLDRSIRSGQNSIDSITLPPLVRDSITRAMNAVFNMPPSKLKDTLVNLFQLNVFGPNAQYEVCRDSFNIYHNLELTGFASQSPKALEAYVNSNASFYASWNSGNFGNTPNPALNQLIQQYRLRGVGGTTLFGIQIWKLTSDLPNVNTRSLIPKLQAISGFAPGSVKYFRYAGEGNDIQLAFQQDGIELRFENNCNDCPAGCRLSTYWRLKYFFNNCSVQFIEERRFNPFNLPVSDYTCIINAFLPLRFLSFQATNVGTDHLLQWQVQHLGGTERMEVQRAANAIGPFETVATITPQSSTGSSGHYRHRLPATAKKAFYRIKAVDADGKYQLSQVQSLEGAPHMGIALRPSVARPGSLVQISGAGLGQWKQASLLNPLGQQVQSYTGGELASGLLLPASLRPGLYYLRMQTTGGDVAVRQLKVE